MTLCAVLTFLCLQLFTSTVYVHTRPNEISISVLIDRPRLMNPPRPTDFMEVHQFYFWMAASTGGPASEGTDAFIYLVLHQRPLIAA